MILAGEIRFIAAGFPSGYAQSVVLSRAIAFSKVYPGWILANKVFVNPANFVLNRAGVPGWQSAVKSFNGK